MPVKAPYQFIPILPMPPSIDTTSMPRPLRAAPPSPSSPPPLSPDLPTPDFTRLHRAAKSKLRSRSLRQDRDLRVMLCHVQLLETTEKEMQRAVREREFWHQRRLAAAKALEQARMVEWKQSIVGDEQKLGSWMAGPYGDEGEGTMNPADWDEEWMYRVW